MSKYTKLKPIYSDETNKLREYLNSKIINQTEAIDVISDFYTIFRSGIRNQNSPISSILLMGPTGVGKTYTVEELCKYFYNDPTAMLKINCGEFTQHHEVAKLIGAPPGYLGHRETTPLITQSKLSAHSNPFSIVLFDEIEKASADFNKYLLSILDKAELNTNGASNPNVKFDNSMIFLTSNLGVSEMNKIMGKSCIGYSDTKMVSKHDLRTVAINALKRSFTPEFVNRIDAIVVYNYIDKLEYRKIIRNKLEEIQEQIVNQSKFIKILYTNKLIDYLVDVGFSDEFGARELNRVIKTKIILPLCKMLDSEQLRDFIFLHMSIDKNGEVTFEGESSKLTDETYFEKVSLSAA